MQVKGRGTIITVTSNKGGVGKTLTTLNLAGVFALLKKKVLIIDLDIYGGNIATYVNSNNEKTVFNLVEDFTNNRYEGMNDYIFNYSEYISIIAAPKDPRLANKIDSKFIPIILENVIYNYDIVLIDTFHILNNINITTMDNSDKILYLFTNDSFDLKNTKSFTSIIKDTGMDNVIMVLNESLSLEKPYYSLYDIRNIIKHNVDFTLPKSLYIRNIDKYIIDASIPTLNNSLGLLNSKDGKKLIELAKYLIDEDKEDKKWKKLFLKLLK